MENKKYAVATGHKETSRSAGIILKNGGNAYDAILGAFFTACVVEPSLASLGGGGFCLAQTKQGEQTLFDFFVQTPQNKKISKKVDFYPVEVDFGGAIQEFHIGAGAIATPGAVKGIFAIHKKLGSMPLAEIIRPAVKLAREGSVVEGFPAFTFELLEPIFKGSKESFQIFKSEKKKGELVQRGELLKNPDLAKSMELLAEKGEDEFYKGEIANKIASDMQAKGGYLSKKDLEDYQVEIRKPLQIKYQENKFTTNTIPSAGGTLISFALKLLEKVDLSKIKYGTSDYVELLSAVMEQAQIARFEKLNSNIYNKDIAQEFLSEEYLKEFRENLNKKINRLGSTTHLSVIDNEGNIATMTVTNGEGSSYIIPGTGIMLNNMLGEEDLNPEGFHNWKENQRLSSMMAPSILENNDFVMALGSAGSNRIRSAIVQTIIRYLNFDKNIEEAVNDFRVHFENGKLDVEPGLPENEIVKIKKEIENVNIWKEKSVFFGGANCVVLDKKVNKFSGAGDVRREGFAIVRN